MEAKVDTWDVPAVRLFRWVLFLPLGLSIFWLAEVFVNMLVLFVLDWDLGALLFWLVYILGGCVLFIAIIVIAGLTRSLTSYLTPIGTVGVLLVGAVYGIAQLIWVFDLMLGEGMNWPAIITKVEFTAVVGYLFLFNRSEATE